MFAQSIQVPAQGYAYTTSYNPADAGILGWNAQPIIGNSILRNDLMGRMNSIGAGDFFGITNQLPVHYAINGGLGVNNVLPTMAANAMGLNGLGFNGVSPALSFGMSPYNNWQTAQAAQLAAQGISPLNQFGGGNWGMNAQGQFAGGFGLLGVIDNDSEVVFALGLPGVSASHVDINVVNGEIRVRLTSGSTNSSKTTGGRAVGTFASARTPLYSLPLPAFCDANKVTAKVEQGRLIITCSRTGEYVKNITRVKVS